FRTGRGRAPAPVAASLSLSACRLAAVASFSPGSRVHQPGSAGLTPGACAAWVGAASRAAPRDRVPLGSRHLPNPFARPSLFTWDTRGGRLALRAAQVDEQQRQVRRGDAADPGGLAEAGGAGAAELFPGPGAEVRDGGRGQ